MLLSGTSATEPEGTTMSEVMNLILEEAEILELERILLDDDADAALAWLKAHLVGKSSHLLEGRSRPQHPRL
jgi:hypothetical protein